MSNPVITVLVTLDSKVEEARFMCAALRRAGANPWLIDLSLRPHENADGDLSGGDVAQAVGLSWHEIGALDRAGAADKMIAGGCKIVADKMNAGGLAGAIGVGGANGTTMACAIMRSLPPLFPKVMVSAVAATGAVQWYVAESDIAMFPTIGDTALNRITRAVIENAACAVSAMARGWIDRQKERADATRLIGVSSFGGTQGCVDRVTERLKAHGFEVMHFHASGPGGKALENLSRLGELSGVIDITTSELTDLVVDGVYSAGDGRLNSAGACGLPQIVVPGALDHGNFWVGQVPAHYRSREFFQYNAQNMLMRTNAEEYQALGKLVAGRLSEARGPVAVLIPKGGYSEHTKRRTHDVTGKECGPWHQPETDQVFVSALRQGYPAGDIRELDLHINDPAFADACVDAFMEMMTQQSNAPGTRGAGE